MRTLITAILIVFVVGCSKKATPAESTRDLVATLTLAILEYDQRPGVKLEITDNAQIFKALTGQNDARRNVYIPYENSRKAGLFLDFWQRELKFFPDERGSLVACSAGPDGIFLSSDDIRGDEYPFVKKYLNQTE